jgi:hypothetical protein
MSHGPNLAVTAELSKGTNEKKFFKLFRHPLAFGSDGGGPPVGEGVYKLAVSFWSWMVLAAHVRGWVRGRGR